jgi:hypothetical protein
MRKGRECRPKAVENVQSTCEKQSGSNESEESVHPLNDRAVRINPAKVSVDTFHTEYGVYMHKTYTCPSPTQTSTLPLPFSLSLRLPRENPESREEIK